MNSVQNRNINKKPQPQQGLGIHPKKFTLWLMIVGMIMLFAGFTSAYIVRRAEGNWFQFELPSMFTYTTIIALLGSISMLWAQRAAKRDELDQIKIALGATLVLGLAFCYGQYLAAVELINDGIYFVNSEAPSKISGSFLYVIAGLHLAHIFGGLIYLTVMLVKSFQLKIHKKATLGISMCATYWHFVGILWIYLFLFLNYAR